MCGSSLVRTRSAAHPSTLMAHPGLLSHYLAAIAQSSFSCCVCPASTSAYVSHHHSQCCVRVVHAWIDSGCPKASRPVLGRGAHDRVPAATGSSHLNLHSVGFTLTCLSLLHFPSLAPVLPSTSTPKSPRRPSHTAGEPPSSHQRKEPHPAGDATTSRPRIALEPPSVRVALVQDG